MKRWDDLNRNMDFVRNRFEQGLIRSTISDFVDYSKYFRVAVGDRISKDFSISRREKTKKTTVFSGQGERSCPAGGGSLSIRSLQKYFLLPFFLTSSSVDTKQVYIRSPLLNQRRCRRLFL